MSENRDKGASPGEPRRKRSRAEPARDSGRTAAEEALWQTVALLRGEEPPRVFRQEQRSAAEAIRLAEEAGAPELAALARLELANWFQRQGDAQSALRESELGLACFAKGERRPSNVKQYRQKAEATALELFRGELDAPRETLRSAHSRRALRVALHTNVGNGYLAQRQLHAAEPHYALALELAGELPQAERIGHELRCNQAWLALERGDVAAALALLPSRQVFALGSQRLRSAWLALGSAQLGEGRADAAVATLGEAVELYRAAEDRDGLARVLALRSQGLRRLGRAEEARAELTEVAGEEGLAPSALWLLWVELAELHREAGELRQALAAYERYAGVLRELAAAYGTDPGRYSLLQSHRQHLDALVEVAVAVADREDEPGPALRAVGLARARSLGAMVTSRAEDAGPRPGAVLASQVIEGIAQEGVPGLQFVDGAEIGPRADDGRLWDQDLQLAGGDPWPLPGAWLEYYLLPKALVLLARSRAGEARVLRLATGRAELEERVAALRRALRVGGEGPARSFAPESAAGGAAWEPLARTLYRLLVEPVQDLLGPAGTPLVLVPHEVLWRLPFATLRDAAGVSLGERHPLSTVISRAHAGWVQARPRPHTHENARILLVANPTLDLAGAEGEAEDIARRFGEERAVLLAREQADTLRVEAWHREFSILHLATHGSADDAVPLRSHVRLAPPGQDAWSLELPPPLAGVGPDDPPPANQDGAVLRRRDDPRLPVELLALPSHIRRLAPAAEQPAPRVDEPGPRGPELPLQDDWGQAFDVASLEQRDRLSARRVLDHFHLQADLVVLSACETGLGQAGAEGIIGLSRAFLAAGARTILVSLWQVPDAATRTLMVRFYAEYLVHGDKARALQSAMCATRTDFAHPRAWAGFILIGAGA